MSEIVVTQEDREAAADLCELIGHTNGVPRRRIDEAFARHRQQAIEDAAWRAHCACVEVGLAKKKPAPADYSEAVCDAIRKLSTGSEG